MRGVKRNITLFFLALLLIIEWAFDVVSSLWRVVHEAVKELATALEIKHKELKQVAGEPDSRKK